MTPTGILSGESTFHFSSRKSYESGGMKMYPWMKNVNWRKTGLKLGYGGMEAGRIGGREGSEGYMGI